MELIDTHAHIYLPEFDSDRKQIVERALIEGINRIIMPAIDSKTHVQMLGAEEEFSVCISMIGLHPCSVKEDFQQEISIVEDYLSQRSFVAIGEIGLDFYWDKTFISQQYEAFHLQIGLALTHGLPVVIHSRDALDECISVVQQYPQLTGIFHCFSGTIEQAKKITDAGFLLGIGGVVTFKNAGLDKVISEIGISRIVLETDAPYLAPVPYRGNRNESSYLKIIAERIAAITNIPVEKVVETTTENATKVFKLN
ncbi:MAG: TatD family hydrolase [Chitinophagaceae bacterium]